MRKRMSDERALRLAVTATLAIFALCTSSLASDQDRRPSQIPYDTQGGIPTTSLAARPNHTVEVEIKDHSLAPRLTILTESTQLRWVNQSRAGSRIVFEREVAASMTCHNLINFSIKGDELKSAELQRLDVANFCKLKPGRYPYRIIRSDPTTGASRRLEGIVVVEPVDGSQKLARSE
jgi:hypothetical protein